ncbi:hypothetical protein CR983_02270 [Candidatus Saccharibacteria bacterium]|nr:MAG: hypothetical protein CR983_02270 [Candidatus Saccharibacteria bacterium]
MLLVSSHFRLFQAVCLSGICIAIAMATVGCRPAATLANILLSGGAFAVAYTLGKDDADFGAKRSAQTAFNVGCVMFLAALLSFVVPQLALLWLVAFICVVLLVALL